MKSVLKKKNSKYNKIQQNIEENFVNEKQYEKMLVEIKIYNQYLFNIEKK